MDLLALIISMQYRFGYILLSLTLISKSTVLTEQPKSINSHNVNSKSQIPWNMLLDPNYTSHKKTSPLNHTYQPPFRHTAPNLNNYVSPHHNYHVVQETTQSPKPSQFSYQYVPHMNNVFSASEALPSGIPQRIDFKPYSSSHSSQPVENVMFPSNPSYHATRPEVQKQTSRPLLKNKDSDTKREETRKQKKKKPVDYFEADDEDYMDTSYPDYDYPSQNERPSYSPPRKHPKFPKHKGDPLGLLPSASDPNGFFSKAKDILKGASYGRPSYSATTPDYYSQYSPNKHYGEPEHSYYNDDAYGNSDYPPKSNYYGSPGFDYELPIEGSPYGGMYPDKRKGTKYGPLAFALGLLPLGLLLASLVPTVVTIPVTTAVATGRRRKRSVEFINPAINIISSYGVAALEDPVCLHRIFCEVARDGKQETSSVVQKFYYKLAYILDEKIADFIGVKSLITAIRKNRCDDYICLSSKKMPSLDKNSTSV